MVEWDFEMGQERAKAYCAGAEHCNSEVKAMLERHGLADSHIVRILENLSNDNFVNESRYAMAFANDKVRFQHWGRRKIAQSLKMKRIDSSVIGQALEGIDMQTYMEVLEQVVKNCYRQAKAPTQYARNMKALRSVVSRGFEPELAYRFIPDSKSEGLCDIYDETI